MAMKTLAKVFDWDERRWGLGMRVEFSVVYEDELASSLANTILLGLLDFRAIWGIVGQVINQDDLSLALSLEKKK